MSGHGAMAAEEYQAAKCNFSDTSCCFRPVKQPIFGDSAPLLGSFYNLHEAPEFRGGPRVPCLQAIFGNPIAVDLNRII